MSSVPSVGDHGQSTCPIEERLRDVVFLVWKRDALGEPNGNLPVSARGDRVRLFLEMCSSKKRDNGHKMFLGGSNMM